MPEILQRIDDAISRCPCGGTPLVGSRYCSDDCRPDPGLTITEPMRWQPPGTPDHDDPWADVMPAPEACECCGEGWWTGNPETRCLKA